VSREFDINKDTTKIYRKAEISKKNKRFAAVFSKTSLIPVFKNRNSLKKLISKTKIV